MAADLKIPSFYSIKNAGTAKDFFKTGLTTPPAKTVNVKQSRAMQTLSVITRSLKTAQTHIQHSKRPEDMQTTSLTSHEGKK